MDHRAAPTKVHRYKLRQRLLHTLLRPHRYDHKQYKSNSEMGVLGQSHSPAAKISVSSSHRRSMLRPLVECLHSGVSHFQRQRRIETTKLQLDQLETSCSSKLTIRKQAIELFGSANWAVVLRGVFGAEGSCQLGIVPVRQLVVGAGERLEK